MSAVPICSASTGSVIHHKFECKFSLSPGGGKREDAIVSVQAVLMELWLRGPWSFLAALSLPFLFDSETHRRKTQVLVIEGVADGVGSEEYTLGPSGNNVSDEGKKDAVDDVKNNASNTSKGRFEYIYPELRCV